MSRFASVRHPWRPDLVIHASVRRFQRGHNPLAVILHIKAKTVSLELRFGRPDKAKPPSGNGAAVITPDGAYRLSGLLDWCGFIGPAYFNPVFAFIALITEALSARYCCNPLARK
jgi:hypothetical protein